MQIVLYLGLGIIKETRTERTGTTKTSKKIVDAKLAKDFQRLGGLSYFAGAEEKNERVLVHDLGSLTSIHDR
ncbi:hypothetical protein IFM89_031102 [Coptis chinensis]|uniref:Uncharacterized protein n=1 Tax=Coptis chinensis TaxID=261450 RepID=A0A835MCR4_9MAGN|nr:hypothetical protein IFM89_031102 [Coptis chinensis]